MGASGGPRRALADVDRRVPGLRGVAHRLEAHH